MRGAREERQALAQAARRIEETWQLQQASTTDALSSIDNAELQTLWDMISPAQLDADACLAHFQLFGMRVGRDFSDGDIRGFLDANLPATFSRDQLLQALRGNRAKGRGARGHT